MFPLYFHYTFCVPRKRKTVKRHTLLHLKPALRQILQIRRQRIRSAGNINNPLRRKLNKRRQKCLAAPRAGRVHNNHISLFPSLCHFGHKLPGIRIVKFDIMDVIPFCICNRIAYGVLI